MFGTAGVSHEWDALAFGLSTIPAIVTLLFIAAAYWEQRRRRRSISFRKFEKALSLGLGLLKFDKPHQEGRRKQYSGANSHSNVYHS